ncbi:MAG: FG-GAP repeat domain-containing protein, partial [Fidelibacterota bacterium]
TVDVAIKDINGDSWNDIIVANQNEPRAIYFNNGTWNFNDIQAFSDPLAVCSIAVTDFDNNGYSEPVLGTNDGTGVILFKNTSALNGRQIIPFKMYMIGNVITDVLTGDLNDDGFSDLVIANNKGVYVLGNRLSSTPFKPVLTVDIEPDNPQAGLPFQLLVTLKSQADTPIKNGEVQVSTAWMNSPSPIQYTDEDGVAAFDFVAPSDPGDYKIMATTHRNYLEESITFIE